MGQVGSSALGVENRVLVSWAALARGHQASREYQLMKLGWALSPLSQGLGRAGVWTPCPLPPAFPVSLGAVTPERKDSPFEPERYNFGFFFFLRGVGFCTRLTFLGESFELKISLEATLLETDWGCSSPTPSCLCFLYKTFQYPGRIGKGQN